MKIDCQVKLEQNPEQDKSKPKRVQMKRIKGVRLQEQASNGREVVLVSRPSRFGNPYQVIKAISADNSYFVFRAPDIYVCGRCSKTKATSVAIEKYEQYIKEILESDADFLEPLRDKDLSCFCNLESVCHADVILKILYGKSE